MSLLAVLADIHGNLTALEAVLEDLARFEVGGVLCLGDVASFGPQPRKTLRRLRKMNPQMIMGNTDAYLLEPRTEAEVARPDEDTPFILEVEAWSAAQLSEDDLAYVRSFAPSLRLELAGLEILAYHGSPQSYHDPIRATSEDAVLDGYLGGAPAGLYLGAHTHEQFARRYRAAILANPGSVGLSFVVLEGEGVNCPVAEYALVEVANGLPNIALRRVPYDLAALRSAVRASDMPQQERWLSGFRPGPL